MPKKSGRSRSASSRASEFTHEHKWIVGAVLAVAIVGIVYYLYEWYESVTVTVFQDSGSMANYNLELGTYKATGSGPDATISAASSDLAAFAITLAGGSTPLPKTDVTKTNQPYLYNSTDRLTSVMFSAPGGNTTMVVSSSGYNFSYAV